MKWIFRCFNYEMSNISAKFPKSNWIPSSHRIPHQGKRNQPSKLRLRRPKCIKQLPQQQQFTESNMLEYLSVGWKLHWIRALDFNIRVLWSINNWHGWRLPTTSSFQRVFGCRFKCNLFWKGLSLRSVNIRFIFSTFISNINIIYLVPEGCNHKLWIITVIPGNNLVFQGKKTLPTLLTRRQCAEKCLHEKEFPCLSASFGPSHKNNRNR